MAKSDDPKIAASAPAHVSPEIMHGVGTGSGGPTEDQKRALGIDASQGATEHDDSPEANRGGSQGGLYDTYGPGARAQHANLTGETAELALGQAPQAPAAPMAGSANVGEQVDMDLPNAINRSPIVRGVDPETRERTEGPTFEDLKPDNDKKDDENTASAKRAARTKAVEEGSATAA